MKARYNWIPTELSQSDFNEFIFPHLTKGRWGPKPRISYFKMFNYFLYLMHTGCQWHQLPIDKDPFGRSEISYSRLFRHFQHWIDSGFFDRAFEASVAKLAKESLLDTSVLHGDGTTTAAKKGAIILAEVATTGDKIVALCDRNCNVVALFFTASGNANKTKLFPAAFNKLKEIAKAVGMDILGSVICLGGAYDSKKNRKMIFNAHSQKQRSNSLGLIKENTRPNVSWERIPLGSSKKVFNHSCFASANSTRKRKIIHLHHVKTAWKHLVDTKWLTY